MSSDTRELSGEERIGLAQTFSLFVPEIKEHSTTLRQYRISFSRGGYQVGDALYIGFGVFEELAYFARSGFRGDTDYDSDYEHIASGYGLPEGFAKQIVTLEMLEEAQPGATDNPDDAQRLREDH